MPYSHRRSSGTRRGTRRRTQWCRLNGTIAALPAGNTAVLDLGALIPTMGGYTVLRTHVHIQVPFVASGDSYVFGLIIGRDTDVGTSANRAPDPLNDTLLPWRMNYKMMPASSGAAVNVLERYDFDIRSKSKIDSTNQKWLMSIHNSAGQAGTLNYMASTLFALP